MSWYHQDIEVFGVPHGYVGFVYQITRLSDGKRYLGQKGFWTKVTKPPLKGKKLKRRSQKESDWQEYFGSNAELLNDVESEGRDGFRRDILRLCKSKSEMNYYESREIFVQDALLRPDEFYNRWVSVRVNGNTLKQK